MTDNFNQKQINDLIQLGKWKAREIASRHADRMGNKFILQAVRNAYTTTKTIAEIHQEANDIRELAFKSKMVELTGREVL
jgi:hypothetical protein